MIELANPGRRVRAALDHDLETGMRASA